MTGFCRVLAPGDPPANSTKHQQWEASSSRPDLDSAPEIKPELCLGLGWSCRFYWLPAAENGPLGCRGRAWATLGAGLGASSPPWMLALHTEELPGEKRGSAGPSQPWMVSQGRLGGRD